MADILDDAASALWNRDLLEACRVEKSAVPELTRVVVAIDPSMTFSETSNETGIIVAGLGKDKHGYISRTYPGSIRLSNGRAPPLKRMDSGTQTE